MSIEVSITVCTIALLTWRVGLLCAASSFSIREVTASSVVKAGSNPYSKYTIDIILLYSPVGMQKYKIEWQNLF